MKEVNIQKKKYKELGKRKETLLNRYCYSFERA